MSLSYEIVDIDSDPIVVIEIFHDGAAQTNEQYAARTSANSIHADLLSTFGITTNKIIEKVIVIPVVTSNNSYKSTNNTTFTPLIKFIFPGTNKVGIPTTIKATAWIENAAANTRLRVRDVDNSNVIAANEVINNTSENIVNLGTISNLPEEQAIFSIMVRTDNATYAASVSSIIIEF